MIKDVFLSVCDNCNTVSLAPEYTPCINCGSIMANIRFVREAVEQQLALDATKSCQNCNHASICVQDEPGCILWSPRK